MTDIAISVQNLGKKYTIGHQKSGSLRESFASKVRGLFTPTSMEQEEFWALKDINFEIKRGEAVGIIGRNGAGKSTLLKILSRITDPSTGRFEINGRVSSLLEVGTGFHPELSGRENIYLNGTILGMKRAEIKAKFDEIVAFSGVEKFIDTPVKHYSSGMKVRLAFSVAAHLEPEILIVDEVLAVGDAEFQKKCLGKMDEVSKNEGRTVLFVSHNMGAVESLCSTGLLLKEGRIERQDSISNVISRYLSFDSKENINGEWFFTEGPISQIETYTNGIKSSSIFSGSSFKIKIRIKGQLNFDSLVFGLAIKSILGEVIAAFNNTNYSNSLELLNDNDNTIEVTINEFSLYKPDFYWLDFYLGNEHSDFFRVQEKVQIQVVPANVLKGDRALKPERNLIYFRHVNFKIGINS